MCSVTGNKVLATAAQHAHNAAVMASELKLVEELEAAAASSPSDALLEL